MIIVFQIHFSALWVSLKVIDITRAGAIVRDSYIQTALDVISSPDLKLFAWLCPVLGNLRSESGLLVGTELSNSFSKVVAPGLIYIYIYGHQLVRVTQPSEEAQSLPGVFVSNIS